MSRFIRISALALSALMLSACSILPEPEQLHVYRLPGTAPSVSTLATPSPMTLQVNRPSSNQILDSSRIVVLPDGNQVSTYQGVRWSDRAPTMLRDRLIDSFISANSFAAVRSDDNHLQTDLQLVSTLRAFQSEYRNGAPQVQIQLDVQLVDSQQQIIASRRFSASQAATGNSVENVVEAFGSAVDNLSTQLLQWTLSQSHKSNR
ncbi:ABC-type transport auxiliary lipoprotein family protein [Pseudomonas sp. S9]|uniref:ABC-type transport auxiliary lipoprotein family protein n=1 Tax=Pseudomonas sp. S9 TaxID=686578 RepID=UPI0002556CB9|nr:ABC-type transport auxiliary lipoprotein family protein [Pseudomonas sp. S9]